MSKVTVRNKARDRRLKGKRKALLRRAKRIRKDFVSDYGEEDGPARVLALLMDRIGELEDILKQVLETCESGECTRKPGTTCWRCKGAWEMLTRD